MNEVTSYVLFGVVVTYTTIAYLVIGVWAVKGFTMMGYRIVCASDIFIPLAVFMFAPIVVVWVGIHTILKDVY